jgi:primosomal protein N' (replication factor Y) (superfamily II helicase)
MPFLTNRMYIATVIPIQKGSQKEYLSYFSATDIPLGSIVSIPVRTKTIDAIVINIEEARNIKSDIKNADYQLKKIIKVKGGSPFNKSFFIACQKMKDYTVSNTGSIIKSLLPTIFIENIEKLNKPASAQGFGEAKENIKHEKLIFQATPSDRLAFYRTLIREAFAKKESVFLCVPTHFDIYHFHKELARGIEQFVFTFHSGMTKKALIKTYNSVIDQNHPILIVSTGIFLSVPRHDIKTIILEHESSDTYKQIGRPYVDIRSFAEVLSGIEKIKLIFGDTLLRPETLYRHDQNEFGEISSPLYRLPQTEQQIVVDMKNETDEKGKKVFKTISRAIQKMINETISNNKSVLLFSVRKGLAPITVCNDCGHTLLCPNCSTPIVLYGTKQIAATKSTTPRIFMCNKCGRKEKTEISCPNCSSWNLTPLGVGTDRVYEEIKSLYPKAKVIQIDKEATPTIKEARSAMQEFNKNSGNILIGTEMVFSYLENQVNSSAIISLDGLFSIPSFNITQKILHIIEKLHNITLSNLIIQTRIPENKILQYILSGNVLPLCREDLAERKDYGYPPFKRLIKITFEGTAGDTEKARSFIEKTLGNYEPQIFSAFVSRVKGQYITNTVIKVDPRIWPLPTDEKLIINQNLSRTLSQLPPSFSINVDPEDLL